MTYFIAPNGIEFRSKIAYYRTLENQGSRSNSTFLKQMLYKYVPGHKEKEQKRVRELCKLNHERYYKKRTRSNGTK